MRYPELLYLKRIVANAYRNKHVDWLIKLADFEEKKLVIGTHFRLRLHGTLMEDNRIESNNQDPDNALLLSSCPTG